jgi:hypothetical protein
MRNLIAGLCLMLAMSPLALAQEKATGGGEPVKSEKRVKAKKPLTAKQLAHQQKMKDCSRKAADQKLKGPDRREFMKTCLKG